MRKSSYRGVEYIANPLIRRRKCSIYFRIIAEMSHVPPFRAVPPVSAHSPETGASVGRSHTDERAPTTFPLSHRESVTLSINTTTAFEAGQHIFARDRYLQIGTWLLGNFSILIGDHRRQAVTLQLLDCPSVSV